ncbi:radical SAM protein [Embleya sp. NBC_00896]|uniref:radical SAM protein n=1 Tax=Embleya sp. NBC_00896 TaxID=2975961 RepID=UPI002F913976|nr:radical SAM protein [Embleya sp. NBC_00896]
MTITSLDPAIAPPRLDQIQIDITRRCQANCIQCYNESGPGGTTGDMTLEEWLSALDQGAAMGATRAQIIGGEPLLHQNLPELLTHALDLGVRTEVYSNLIHVREPQWQLLRQDGASLATSYYSDRAAEHEQITRNRGSYARTKANIVQALEYGIPLRANIIRSLDGQRVTEATEELRALGVQHIRIDRQRAIGRACGSGAPDTNELCGRCADGRVTILPNGDVTGCSMSSWLIAGNAHTAPLNSIVGGDKWREMAAALPPRRTEGCTPDNDTCAPHPVTD